MGIAVICPCKLCLLLLSCVMLACARDKWQEVISDIGVTANKVVVTTYCVAICFGNNRDLRSCHGQESYEAVCIESVHEEPGHFCPVCHQCACLSVTSCSVQTEHHACIIQSISCQLLLCHVPALPCPALPCPALPCPALPCPALSVPPCPDLPCPALTALTKLHYRLSFSWSCKK